MSAAKASAESKTVIGHYVELLNVVKFQEEVINKQYTEIPLILDEWQSTMRKWKAERSELIGLRREFSSLEGEMETKDIKIKVLHAELKEARDCVRAQMDEINALKADLNENEKRLGLIRDVMKVQMQGLGEEDRLKLAFLRDPNLLVRVNSRNAAARHGYKQTEPDTSSDLDYDQTGDSVEFIDRTSRGNLSNRVSANLNRKRSNSAQPQSTRKEKSRLFSDVLEEESEHTPPKRSRDEHVTTVTVDQIPSTGRPSRTRMTIRRSLNRSRSANDLFDTRTPVGIKDMVAQNQLRSTSNADLRTPLRPVSHTTWLTNGKIETRRHTFVKFSTTFTLTSCTVCSGGINFAGRAAVKCKDCQQLVHISCKNRLAMPCIPRPEMPIKTPNKSKNGRVLYKLQDFCPTSSPMIAGPIIYCVVELEKRGMTREGLYRVPGMKSVVTNVLNEFRTSKSVPKVELLDVEVIGDVVKQFLRELRDPLIPKTSRDEFIKAAANGQMSALNNAIFDLPQANRDTLAYLILHWQRVAEQCQLNKMPIDNIASCVALSVMGQSSYDDMTTADRETKDRKRVLQQLLNIDAEYWERYISPNSGVTPGMSSAHRIAPLAENTNTPKYPLSNMDCSLLGPINSSPKSQALIRTPVRPNRFFPEPY